LNKDPHIVRYFSGTSGLVLPVKNKAAFPPEQQQASRLQYYSSVFNSIEINSTFKKIPRLNTIQRWSSEVTPGFRFTFKIPESVSHAAALKYPQSELDRFLQAIEPAATHAGCILLQFPASFSSDHLDALLNLINEISTRAKDWQLAVELRHISWYEHVAVNVLKQLNISYVTHDFHSMTQKFPETIIGSFVYLRFHGPEKGYRGSYDEIFLKEYAKKIKHWLSKELFVYAYFNNTLGAAVANLQTLNTFVL
jgi:uncharacterized protein YecE (DUF72 family)